ncbi:hypothetical protein E2562_018294 [Oryza meyeriana var. granulata]|uniref:Uncharacterized protein n=1 Tax=Oryza meyeriana var. granulata TaxID=110450 RepID=A0A6G1CRA1_9ORYZ|nr:hypothetical protein E2562_018294 [Oryza meyeriana var. granulata]
MASPDPPTLMGEHIGLLGDYLPSLGYADIISPTLTSRSKQFDCIKTIYGKQAIGRAGRRTLTSVAAIAEQRADDVARGVVALGEQHPHRHLRQHPRLPARPRRRRILPVHVLQVHHLPLLHSSPYSRRPLLLAGAARFARGVSGWRFVSASVSHSSATAITAADDDVKLPEARWGSEAQEVGGGAGQLPTDGRRVAFCRSVVGEAPIGPRVASLPPVVVVVAAAIRIQRLAV